MVTFFAHLLFSYRDYRISAAPTRHWQLLLILTSLKLIYLNLGKSCHCNWISKPLVLNGVALRRLELEISLESWKVHFCRCRDFLRREIETKWEVWLHLGFVFQKLQIGRQCKLESSESHFPELIIHQKLLYDCFFASPILYTYTSLPLDGLARNAYYLLYLSGYARSHKFIVSGSIRFLPPIPEERKKHLAWAGIEPSSMIVNQLHFLKSQIVLNGLMSHFHTLKWFHFQRLASVRVK